MVTEEFHLCDLKSVALACLSDSRGQVKATESYSSIILALNQSFQAKKNMTDHSVCQRDFPEQQSVYFAEEICCFDPKCALVVIPVMQEPQPSNRNKFHPTYQRTKVAHRLLPRRPRIGEKQPSGDGIQRWNGQKSDTSVSAKDFSSSGARPKAAVLKKSISLEPELLSVACKRYREIHEISALLPHKHPYMYMSQRSSVPVSRISRRCDHHVEKGERQRKISEFNISNCKSISLRANSVPLRASSSPKEREEFEEWRRKFYDEMEKEMNSTEKAPVDHKASSLERSGDGMSEDGTSKADLEFTPPLPSQLASELFSNGSQQLQNEDGKGLPDGLDLQLIKRVNRRRHLFSAPNLHQTESSQLVLSEEDKNLVDRVTTRRKSTVCDQNHTLSLEAAPLPMCSIGKDGTQDRKPGHMLTYSTADDNEELVEDVNGGSKPFLHDCKTNLDNNKQEEDPFKRLIWTKTRQESSRAIQQTLKWSGSRTRREGRCDASLNSAQHRFLRVIRKRF